jgi:hypothetical protein
MNHPEFGPMRFFSSEGLWVGETADGYELSIRCDFFDPDRLDPACEALARRELSDLTGLWERIQAFFTQSPHSRPAHLLGGRWELERLCFTNIDDEGVVHDTATLFVGCHLRGDDHNVWVVRIEDGAPVSLRGY